jgi:hypothetical protein
VLSTAASAVGADPDEDRGAVETTATVAARLVDGSTATIVGADTKDDADDAAADASAIGADDSVATLTGFDTPIKACCVMIGNTLDNEEEAEVEEEDTDDNSEVGSTMASADPLCSHR